MKKDKEWLKDKIKDEEYDLKYVYDNYVPYEKVLISDDVYYLIDQLDEPVKPVIPQFVADWFESNKGGLADAFTFRQTTYAKKTHDERDDIDNWFANTDDVMDILVSMKNGYEVAEEKKYILLINITDKDSKTDYETFLNKRGIFHSMENDSFNSEEFNWTEEEIRGLTKRDILFEHFAVKVEEVTE